METKDINIIFYATNKQTAEKFFNFSNLLILWKETLIYYETGNTNNRFLLLKVLLYSSKHIGTYQICLTNGEITIFLHSERSEKIYKSTFQYRK